jgi:hypothetical protein
VSRTHLQIVAAVSIFWVALLGLQACGSGEPDGPDQVGVSARAVTINACRGNSDATTDENTKCQKKKTKRQCLKLKFCSWKTIEGASGNPSPPDPPRG